MSRARSVRLVLALAAALFVLPVCSGGGSGGGGTADPSCAGVEQSLPTTSRRNRAIAGVSMGGFGALNIGTKNQAMFGVIGSMGGPVDLRQLLADIRDDNLEVKRKPIVDPLPMNLGDDFTFDLLPTYPDRQTRIGFTKDLVLAFGNPLLHHTPTAPTTYLASDSEPASILKDDEWGDGSDDFTIPADARGFQDGGDDNEDGVRQTGEATPSIASDALLLASGSLNDVLGVAGGTDVGGRLLADEDGDLIYDVGDGIIVNLGEPFTDGNGNGWFDLGEAFDDFGLDGVAGTGDFGEGNSRYDEDPDIANWDAQDPRARIAGMTKDALCSQRIYMDAGDADELNFLEHHQNVETTINAVLGGEGVVRISDDGDDDCDPTNFPSVTAQYSFLIYPGGHVGFDTAQLDDDLQNGNVCGASASIWQRLVHLLAALNASFPNPVMGGAGSGDTVVRQIASPALDAGGGAPMRTVVIYQPPAHFNTGEDLPIAYFLGGHGQDPEDYDRVEFLLDTLVFTGLIQNMYIAFLPGEGGTEGSFYVNHVGDEAEVPTPPAVTVTSGDYEDSTLELIAAIEASADVRTR